MISVKVDQKKCTGCGNCVRICNNFKMVNNKAQVKDSKPKEISCNKQAKEECPVNAITTS